MSFMSWKIYSYLNYCKSKSRNNFLMMLNLWYALLDLEIDVIEVVLIWLDATSLVDIFHVAKWNEGGLLVDILLLVVSDVSWMLVAGDESRLRGSGAVFSVPFISRP